MDKAGLKVHSRFDLFDTLETREDLEALYEVLSSIKDKNNREAIFTPFALPCNIDFERMKQEGYEQYRYELLPETYKKLAAKDTQAYHNTWELWKEGMDKGLMSPQFHGREHFNLKIFEEKLANKDKEVMTALENRSYTSISNSNNSDVKYTAAFAFREFSENIKLSKIIQDGLYRFEEVFGRKSQCFMAPTANISPVHNDLLIENGIKSIDTYAYKKHQYSDGVAKRELRWLGKKMDGLDAIYCVRNCVFEPLDNTNALGNCKRMISAAFLMKKPAIISSHRVNFSGYIDPKRRNTTLKKLKDLLLWIVIRYPDVEFISMNELQEIIRGKG